MNNTVRRHPRSLQEAYPKDYADPIDRPERGFSVESVGQRLVLLISIVGIPALVVAILKGWI